MNICKKNYQQQYWLRKAIEYGIYIDGREKQAAKDAEAAYRKEYRRRKAREGTAWPL